jgi:hypothetical protein
MARSEGAMRFNQHFNRLKEHFIWHFSIKIVQNVFSRNLLALFEYTILLVILIP